MTISLCVPGSDQYLEVVILPVHLLHIPVIHPLAENNHYLDNSSLSELDEQ